MYLLKRSTRQIKRSFALILALVMITAAAFYTAATETATPANSTEAENNATPKYYNAVENFSSTDNYAGSENIFCYQFKTDNTYSEWQYLDYCRSGTYWYNNEYLYKDDFPSLTDEQFASISKNGKYPAQWILAISNNRYMHLRNYNNYLANMPTIPAVAYLFTADIDGYVNISSGAITLYTEKIAEKGYKALLRITKNDENVYPETGYMELDDNTSATYPDLDFAVSAGDEIRFELTANVNPNLNEDDSVWVKWNPYISIRGEQYLYTETDDIYNGLTAFMYEYFQSRTADTMTATDSLTLAEENAKRSKYGVYTAYDSIYSGGIIPSDDNSVWKYAAVRSVPTGFEAPTADYELKLAAVDSGTKLSWNSAYAEGINALKVVLDSKSYTYMIPNGENSIEIPVALDTDTSFTVQVSGDNGVSEVLEVTSDGSTVIADKNSSSSFMYLDTCAKSGSGISSEYTLTSSECESSYGFLYGMKSVASKQEAESYRRTVIYNAVADEQMMFGFTAPQSGEYEITAPIEVSNNANVFYSILKQDEKGGFTVIDGIRSYADDKSGFVSLVTLKAGETVWLNASSNADCEIHIGIPSVTLKEALTDSAGVTAYKYRAADYIESSYFNKRTYNSGSLTDKSGAVWEFGSFENPIETVDGVTDYDTLGYTDLAVGDDASAVTSQFKPYEIIRGGTWYNSLTMVVASDNTIGATDASGKTGVLYAFLGTNADQRGSIGLPYQSKGFMINVGVGTGKDKVSHNMGIYMKFTAPSSGNITLNLSDFTQAKTLTRVLVLKGDEVVATYGTIPKGTVVDLGYMSKGETAYICYGTNSGFYLSYGGFPIATVSGEKYTLSTDNGSVYTADSADYTVTDSEKITLSDYSAKIGKLVSNWKTKAGESYESGTVYTVSGDDSLTAVYNWLGDITKDNAINAQDISAMRQLLLNSEKSVLADVTSDDSVNLKDLVRMKKWLAGYAVPFDEQ